ncbi:secreted protein [Parafrankia sp. EAN1pec]|uniref:hypothetical protein n=1 Tax=Parafrankia sp. (strain EAN1pec) TaxID=298653 RepID=UPI0000542085|nr:secreted protein [Frankia sp. EAN1pec]
MNALTRIGGFGLALAVLFGVSYVVGTTIGPSEESNGAAGTGAHGHEASAAPGGAPGVTSGDPTAAGLAISAGGYTLAPDTLTWPAGRSQPYTFRVLGPDGRPLTAFTRVHDADLHLIVVRRDLTGYQHLHPTRDAAGTWSVPLRLSAPGVYRVFADFAPTSTPDGADSGTGTGGTAAGSMADGASIPGVPVAPVTLGTFEISGMSEISGNSEISGTSGSSPATSTITLGTDLTVGGDLRPATLPAPSRTATVAGGYTVTLGGQASPDGMSDLVFSVTRAGRPVTDLESYLGSLGHLVVIRQGDLAYLHVHPGESGGSTSGAVATPGGLGGGMSDPTASPGSGDPALSFMTEFPSAGAYRLFLDFKHAGQVRTAEFTMTVPVDGAAPTPTRTPTSAHAH